MDYNLTLNVEKLKITKECKYLGITLNYRLSWKAHLDLKYRSFIASMWQLRRAIGTTWGLKTPTILWTYEAILKPRLTYAAVIWGRRVEKKTTAAMLERLRGLMLRGATGAPKSTPTMALGALLGIGPLQNSILAAAAKTYYRIKNIPDIKLVRKMGPRELTSGGIIDMPQDIKDFIMV